MMGALSGKVALVTGASKGIGAGIAKGLAEQGAAVVVNYASSKEGADRVVAKTAEVKELFQRTIEAFGALDVLVNNAGVYSFGPLESATEQEFHRQFNTNVLGVILATQEAVKLFAEKGGSIINIGTAASQTGAPNMVLYLATKSAVDSVTRVLAKELGSRNIRVNSVNPGGTETEGAHALGVIGSDFQKQLIAQPPLDVSDNPRTLPTLQYSSLPMPRDGSPVKVLRIPASDPIGS
jgi:3-oxoacyl-[acyl-carrier protein] reductase